jgi:hypothetical protein
MVNRPLVKLRMDLISLRSLLYSQRSLDFTKFCGLKPSWTEVASYVHVAYMDTYTVATGRLLRLHQVYCDALVRFYICEAEMYISTMNFCIC